MKKTLNPLPLKILSNYLKTSKTFSSLSLRLSLSRPRYTLINISSLLSLFFLLKLKQSKSFQYKATDKELERVKSTIESSITNLEFKNKGKINRQPVIYGIRGTKYFIEFNINQSNVDIEGLKKILLTTFENGKVKYNFRIIDQNILREEDMYSFRLDYEVSSNNVPGAKNRGTCYIRGTLGKVYDNFLFSMEKNNDFSDLEIEAILKAYEFAFKKKKPENNNNSKSKGIFARVGDSIGEIAGSPFGNNGEEPSDPNDPIAVLHKFGVSVFMPGNKKNTNLDWDYLAGYENVKRSIEDSVLLGLTHGEVYDQITAGTRMKNESNRPKAILFEGPPGCGKTTSAKIIANQVKIPLVYMPIEAIMSKYYGESETRFAQIFEACKALGKSIIFIDEIDSLAQSREGGIHEASRRILSTLLRKIDSFESDGDVLLICATNRKKDLDPALLSRLDITIRFELPDDRMRALIFQRYAKHLSQDQLQQLGEISRELSGRDIAEVCKDAERRWAAMYIRKEKKELLPDVETYMKCLIQRREQMKNVNTQFEQSEKASWNYKQH